MRTPAEFQAVHARGALLLCLDEFTAAGVERLGGDKERAVYLICRSGRRSLEAAQLLEREGFTQVFNVEGGTLEWEEAGLPVVRAS